MIAITVGLKDRLSTWIYAFMTSNGNFISLRKYFLVFAKHFLVKTFSI